jgi:hypothetical protein
MQNVSVNDTTPPGVVMQNVSVNDTTPPGTEFWFLSSGFQNILFLYYKPRPSAWLSGTVGRVGLELLPLLPN